ncbi:required for excision 1-B domain-containing protein-like [Ornithodoros turicata]
MVDNSSDVFSLLKKVCSLQEERAYTYKLFEEGHKIYLSTAPNYDFATFRELVCEVTQEFKRISEGVMDIERRLRVDCGSQHLAGFVAALQEEEKAKLELVARLQLARQNILDNPDQHGYQDDIKDMKQRLNKVVERINEHLEELKYEMNDL